LHSKESSSRGLVERDGIAWTFQTILYDPNSFTGAEFHIDGRGFILQVESSSHIVSSDSEFLDAESSKPYCHLVRCE
jgi:hypothetical protein